MDREKTLKLATTVLEDEANAILSLRKSVNDDFFRACQLLSGCQGRIIVMGIGKSGHIAGKLAATFASTGSPAFFMHPSEASHGDLGMITSKDVIIALSKSGNTEEILAILPVIKLLGISLISITGNPNSKLATMADINLDAKVEKEACPLGLAPTSSSTATLALGDALAIALLENRGFTDKDFARFHPGGILGRRLLLHVDELMRIGKDIPMVVKRALVSDALLEITSKGVGMTTVVDDIGRLVGIFTDGDLRRVMDKNMDIRATEMSTVMTRDCKTIQLGTLAVEALKLMEKFNITSLVVVDDNTNKPKGVIHMHDLLRSGLI